MLPVKLVTLGEGRVGKSSLLLRFTSDSFDANNPSTLAASFIEKRVVVGTSAVMLNLWDTAGQECYHALGPLYYRDADCALLVFDLTDRASFDKVQRWVAELRSMVDCDLPLCLAGNKSDLHVHVVPGLTEEAEAYASKVGAKYLPTSALLNRNVDACFLYLCNEVVVRQLHAAERKEEEARQKKRRKGGREEEDEDDDAGASKPIRLEAHGKNSSPSTAVDSSGACCV